ncbi:cupin domain-containing protein [Alloprevotella tannerae]|jgi:putative cupin domain protein|uniref:cupin domain-containing protein n=1 Tax=Alloprevotella tannerae TaxID=76122 RepID=UPI0025CD9634|nr:cupin domain-containing protein [Alloprevotella tannerae]
MIIDFKEIEEQILPSFKGGEKEMHARIFSDDKAKIMCNRLQPGASIGYHKHEQNCEIIYLLKGEATVCYDGREITLLPGQVHYCPMGHGHSLMNKTKEELQFFAVVPEHH